MLFLQEMSILFRFMPGYYGARVVLREGKPPICFVDFTDPSSAAFALQALQVCGATFLLLRFYNF